MEASSEGTQLSYGRLGQLGLESYYWQLPEAYLGDKVSLEWYPCGGGGGGIVALTRLGSGGEQDRGLGQSWSRTPAPVALGVPGSSLAPLPLRMGRGVG